MATFSDGNAVTYVNDGAGNKLSVTYHNKSEDIMTKMEYAGNKVYNNGTLSMTLTGEGYVALSGNESPTYHHYLRDHQGNNRVVINQAMASRHPSNGTGTTARNSTAPWISTCTITEQGITMRPSAGG